MNKVFAFLVALGMGLALAQKGPVVVGSKIDTEGAVLCQMTKLVLEAGGFRVSDRCSFGPTAVVRKALLSGEIDLYPEYTGTAVTQFFPGEKIDARNAAQAYAKAKQLDAKNGVVWLAAAPANNTWAIAVPKALADKENLKTIADFARYVNAGKPVKLAASQEFVDRDDALKAFEKVYGFKLKPEQLLILPGGNTTQTEQAAAQGTSGVNAAMAYGTDGGIAALGLVALTDPQGAVAVYQPALTVRKAVADKYPEIARLMNPIFAALDEATLSSLNAQVAVGGKNPADVARGYLQGKGLLK
ncbi:MULTISPECIES: ABC transporter substrate-binding protein [unclassified Meiothermus]|uniref:ABC transporter substrate-binding protein n=1 Tax=unclassified Meiothermus TaxID=370471 RepID=UPI000D7CB086|nr:MULTISPECIES: ABC transporter substrate-binding protein [unclassified Meiothermus]PZA08927.1 ABC transporter substrate-binding protein [Meiothermus sp. Pnk-1]RYM33239.1 ABC transporter substrate-binding protein [Meiothermus sp. PNK-Is4]